MKIAFFDCMSGISGDMTLGALVDAGINLATIQAGIDSLGLPSCRLVASEVKRQGFRATKIDVQHEPEHAHRHLHHITDMIGASNLSDSQKDLAVRIFTRLGEAEAKVHGTTIQKVHFHEVGAVDSIADVVGAAIGIDLLGVDQIVFSPIPTGHGFVKIAHGRVSIPAPATAELLTGVPLAPSEVESELTTPTGAAIAATVANGFGPLPPMTIENIGWGAGTNDFPGQANVLRLIVGSTSGEVLSDEAVILETNLDDETGEIVGHVMSELLEAGALDVYTSSIQMKKGRPGVKLSVIAEAANVDILEAIMFRETSTIGIRRWSTRRHKLARETATVETPIGRIEGKVVVVENQKRFSPEYESCARIARDQKLSLREVYEMAKSQFGK